MIDAATILVVGGAVMAPVLLEIPTPTAPTETGLVPGDPRTVLAGHARAAAFYRTTAILGITTTASSKAGLFIGTRNAEVMRALIPTHGGGNAFGGGFPKLSAAEVFELVRVVLEAVSTGIDDDDPANGYVVSKDIDVRLTGTPTFVPQRAQFERLVNQVGGGPIVGFEEPTRLADTISEVVRQRFLASTVGTAQGANYDSTDALRAVSALCNTMDEQGINVDVPGLGELGESIVDSAKSLPGRVAGVVGGVLGDALGSIFLSTPVLLALAGYVVYKAVQKT